MLPLISYAQVFKCDVNGKKIYQQKPCASSGEEMAINAPPSEAEQAAARDRLTNYQADKAEQERLDQELWDKERMIRAEEDKADAAYHNARANRLQAAQQARQARALENSNTINSYRRY